MPRTYRFEGRVLRLTFTGATSMPEVAAVVDAGLADGACPERPNVLSDMRGSETIAARPSADLRVGVGIFGDRRARLGPRHAILTQAGAQYGVMRIVQALAELDGLDACVFDDEREAVAWLGE